ncbi:alpha/beta hydrolase-fold protein [Kitasatospora sp. NPDC057904]|uniref:alpha/beta hydrolase-fold protein n=1 Tax=unclassified Kitasatospora TaxID=2633591 RepID=UPI0036DAD16D
MVLFTQATAITLVFVVVNNSNQLYGSWGDLLGTDSHVRAVPVPPVEEAVPNKVGPGAPEQPKVIQQFGPVDDNAVPKDVRTTDVKDRISGVDGKVNAETWLARDVPQMILDNFRAEPGPENWAVAGYSAGAHCAARLALAHPNRYHAGIGMSGYNDPNGQRDSLTAKDPHLREISNPLYALTHAQTPPNVALYLTGQKGDGYEDALALQKAAKAPTSVTPVEVDGPHLTSTWTRLVPSAFTWLTRTIAAKTG